MGMLAKKLVEMAENLGFLAKELPIDTDPLADIPLCRCRTCYPTAAYLVRAEHLWIL